MVDIRQLNVGDQYEEDGQIYEITRKEYNEQGVLIIQVVSVWVDQSSR